jgi:hypothetical protein
MTVYGPYTLKESFGGRKINYTIANYGTVPYGRTLIGPSVLADPLDGCKHFNITNTTTNEAPFIITKRGGCTFATKSINA